MYRSNECGNLPGQHAAGDVGIVWVVLGPGSCRRYAPSCKRVMYDYEALHLEGALKAGGCGLRKFRGQRKEKTCGVAPHPSQLGAWGHSAVVSQGVG